MDVRMEDLGKMMLKQADILDRQVIVDNLTDFFTDTKNSLYLLYGKSSNYFTIVKNTCMLGDQSALKFMEFADESAYAIFGDNAVEYYDMNEIVEIEYNKNTTAIELWIGKGNPQYFQLMAWDESSIKL